MARVKIVKLPKALLGREVFNPGLEGTNGNKQFSFNKHLESGKMSEKSIESRQTLEPVDREDANLEAELGETVVIDVDGMPAHFKIGGKRHSKGGTPLNVPDNSFVFSDTSKMKIKDPIILAQFGMRPKPGGYTPAEISKKYDINKFRKTLADPNSEDLDRKTAEMMISNYNLKLAKLALAQESLKGFPQGIPVIAMPYIESMEIDPSTFLPDQAQAQEEDATQPGANMGTMQYGGLYKAQNGVSIGFNNDPALEKKWAEDADTGPYYRKYVEALKSKDPKKMQAAATLIADADIPGFTWWPGSGQNKLSDMAQILKEEAGKIIKKNTPAPITENDLDIKARQQASELFTKVYQLKEAARKAGDPDKEILYDDELKKLHKLHPEYKAAHGWRQETMEKKGRSTPVSGEYVPPVPAIYYSEAEKNQIADLYSNYITPKPTKATPKKEVTTQPVNQTAAMTDTTIKKSDIVKLSDEQIAELVAQEQAGRVISYQEDGGDLTQYQKGGVSPLQAEAAKRKKPAKTTPVAAKSINQLDPYSGYSPDEIAELLEDPTVLRQSKVSGKQKAGDKGTFGHKVTVEEFVARNPEYAKKFKDTYGRDFDATKDAEIFQKDYNTHVQELAYKRALDAGYDDTQAKSLSKRFADTLGFKAGIVEGSGDPRGIDKKFGEFTSSRFEPSFKSVKKPAPPQDITLPKKEVIAAERKPFERNPPPTFQEKIYAPWWLQDIVKTSGAAADLMRVKKYEPWQATPQVRLPDATFYDPTRELAANTEQANLASQFHQAFTGPKSGAISGVQGQAMKNAADIMAKYNNMNVQIANQLSSERTGIMNQASQNKANLDTQLFDKYTVANQQFDNAKNMARQNLRQSYIDAITNRAKTQALNTLYPNYYTNPITGGFVQFKPGYDKITPNKPHEDADLEAIQKVIQRFPGTTFGEASKYVKGNKGAMDNENDVDAGYLRSQGYSGQ